MAYSDEDMKWMAYGERGAQGCGIAAFVFVCLDFRGSHWLIAGLAATVAAFFVLVTSLRFVHMGYKKE